MGKTPVSPSSGRDIQALAEAVRALGVVLNIAAIYKDEHPVFRRALAERFPAIQAAAASRPRLVLTFINGVVCADDRPVDAKAEGLSRVARLFETRGVRGLILLPGVTDAEVAALAVLMSRRTIGGESRSLQEQLRQEGIISIREFVPRQRGGAADQADDAPGEGDGDVSAAIAPPSSLTFSLDELGSDAYSFEQAFGQIDSGADRPSPHNERVTEFRAFVGSMIAKAVRETSSEQQAVDAITDDFEARLNEEVEEVKKQTESRIRRLENIKEMVLEELESLSLAALVVDAQMNVVAANRSGRNLFDAGERLAKRGDLEIFIASGKEKGEVVIKGKTRKANLVISESPHPDEGAFLICIE